MNQTESTWLSFTQREFVGKRKFSELVCARFYSEYKRVIEALIGGRRISELEIEPVRKDGSMFDAFLRIAAVRDSKGTFLYTRVTAVDITMRENAETEARICAQA
jgi:PAS domain S-box-containing protein